MTEQWRKLFPVIFLSAMLLFGLIFFVYTKNGSASAQEILCKSPEIPVGTTIEEVYTFSQELLSHLQLAVSYSLAQAALSEQLAELPNECKAENCSSGCDTIANTIRCGSFPGNNCSGVLDCAASPCWTEVDADLGICSKYCIQYSCQTTPCEGQACPTTQINNLVNQINQLHQQIADEREAIKKLLEDKYNSSNWKYCRDQTKQRLKKEGVIQDESRADLIRCLLEESRIGLSNCVTSAQFYAGTAEEEVKLLYSCQEARLQGLLSDVQAEQCQINNVFCCDLQ